ncbi:hypothetical protein X975_11568, partial [Stegodyphus mimosarum]
MKKKIEFSTVHNVLSVLSASCWHHSLLCRALTET